QLMLPVLELIAEGRETVLDCLPSIQSRFSLQSEQMEALLPSGKQTTISNRVHWARNYMKHAGLVAPIARGRYKVTELGQCLLDEKPSYIDKSVLERFPLYTAWRAQADSS